MPKNVWQYVAQVPRLARLGRRFVLQGGTQHNLAAVKAQVDYIKARVPDAAIYVHPHCGEAGAIGAALDTLGAVRRRGRSSFIGIDEAIALRCVARSDESTRCHLCANRCTRTFIDGHSPRVARVRFISGFSCYKGAVESKAGMLRAVEQRNRLRQEHVNLVEHEGRLAFCSDDCPEALPGAGTVIEHVRVKRNLLGRIRRVPTPRGFRRSSVDAARRRRTVYIGIPRALGLYGTAPLFLAYFRTLGIPADHIRVSPPTSEAMFSEGASYGSVDGCHPSKIVQAHFHYLLFTAHTRQPLDYVFLPAIVSLPTFLTDVLGTHACPVVAGAPCVVNAAFTKDVSFFAQRGIDFVHDVVSLAEPVYFRRQMFEMWGDRLGVTEDESDFAVDQGWKVLAQFDREMEKLGRQTLERVEAENKLALLVLQL